MLLDILLETRKARMGLKEAGGGRRGRRTLGNSAARVRTHGEAPWTASRQTGRSQAWMQPPCTGWVLTQLQSKGLRHLRRKSSHGGRQTALLIFSRAGKNPRPNSAIS